MKYKFLCLLVVLMLIPISCFSEAAITVTVDGLNVNLGETQPYTVGTTVMLPIRAVGEAMRSEVRWNENSQRVVVENDSNVVTVEIGNVEAYINGEKKILETPPVVSDGTTYVPMSVISNMAGIEAAYENGKLSIYTGSAEYSIEATAKMNEILSNITGSEEFEVERPEDNGIVVDVTDYGASPSNTPLQNIEAFAKAIEAVKEKGAWKLNIPYGEYHLGGGGLNAIELTDITNLKIDGNGATLIFSLPATQVTNPSYIYIKGTERLELNNITLDWDWDSYPLFAIAKVCGADVSAGTVEFEVDNALSDCKLVDDLLYYGISGYDVTTGNKSDLVGYQVAGTVNGIERTGEKTFQLAYNVASNAGKANIGDYAFVAFKTASSTFNAFRMTDNKHMTFDNVEVNGAPYQIWYSDASEYFQVINCRFQPKEGSGHRFVSYGGIETHSVNGYFKLENSVLDGICDDNLHLSNHFFGGGAETGNPKIDDYTVMLDYLQYWAVGNDIYEGAKFVCGSDQFELYNWESTIESFEWEMNVYTGNSQHRCKVKFKDPLPENYDDSFIFWNADKFTGNYIIRGNEFKNGMCHGLYIGLPNGTIENNTFDNFGYPPVIVNCVIRWSRWYIGTPINNVIIRNNALTNNDTARRDPSALFVGGGYDEQPSNYYPVEGRIATNVLVENNVVDNSTWGAFGMFSAKNVVVRNNQFLNSNNLPTKARFTGWGNAFIVNCDDVVFVGNEFANKAGAYEEGLFVDDTTSTNIYAEGNTGIEKVKYMADLIANVEQDYDEDGNLVVDVTSYGYSEIVGTWSDSSRSGYSAVTRQSNSTGASAQWKPILEAGTYNVYIYKVVYPASSDSAAKITVKHKNGISEFTLDYTDGVSGWVELGEFEFEEGTSGYVQNTRGTPYTCRASAVKFQKISD